MKTESISSTYTYLYNFIIQDLLSQICNHNPKYCVRRKIDNVDFPIALEKKYEEYKRKARENMSGERLDRHKLASCICGALIEIRPITGVNGEIIGKTTNEWLAMYVGINVIKSYMVYSLLHNQEITKLDMIKAKEYLTSNFQLKFPSNICDTRQYSENLVNALYRTHSICKYSKTTCFQYDIWAYSKVFYHLELHNQESLNRTYKTFLQTRDIL